MKRASAGLVCGELAELAAKLRHRQFGEGGARAEASAERRRQDARQLQLFEDPHELRLRLLGRAQLLLCSDDCTASDARAFRCSDEGLQRHSIEGRVRLRRRLVHRTLRRLALLTNLA